MNWTEQIDIYCERTDFTFWSEPLNALTNLLYLAGAIWMYRRTRGDGLPIATGLAVLLGLIAIGSFLFHTTATQWASLADTAPIGLFILLYLFAVNRDFLERLWWQAGLMTAAFIPYAAIMVPLLNKVQFFATSNFYWTVPLLLFAYAPFVARKRAETAWGMVAGGLLLSVSITVRSYDETLCEVWPIGTHFIWHALNAIMLPWMIEVYRRHMLVKRAALR
ncbi:ceramidase domain-containing protein [Pseudaestuariivita atlantica]|uniref:Membrane protein n=1 Tax=Pseudaestuariivita atlantica TaxID=1317121 RepID=A0A0L1JLD7_9RHOB|nr:ceramidase domain-containing protein [Pseudaestuariivita atlantica]KNG92564.1 membrane protein [Pseudaestuariivita atlantica]